MNAFLNRTEGLIGRRIRHQGGSIIVTVCLVLLFLLGFMGIAMDFGHLFVVKTELQTAMDSCALSAAQELDGQPLSIARARSAAKTAANMNGVNFQSNQWELTDDNFTFRDKNYVVTSDPIAAKYVECAYTQTGLRTWLLHVMGAFVQNTAAHPNERNVLARAIATRGSALTSCPIPVALIPKSGGTAPNYGYTVGEWINILPVGNNNYPSPGEMGWFNINGSQSGKDTKTQLSAAEGGVCGTAVDQNVELTTNGNKQGVAPMWNFRFGLSMGKAPDWTTEPPDYSGYPYNASNWPAQFDAYPDFVQKRVQNSPHPPVPNGADGKWDPITASLHAQYGNNRRIVTVPVLSPSNKVVDFACMFMLQPMFNPTTAVYLEFRGNAGSANNPCTTSGLAGALAGPLVPVLVR
jgi:Flp pilus assembly protein TadG